MKYFRKLNNSCLMLAVIYLAGLAAPINQFKVPPMMQQLMENLDISLGASGWLMSVFALMGFIFAIPVGIFLRHFSNKTAGLVALGALLTGSLMGGFSASTPVMLLSRIIEGTGMCIFSISAPAAIAAWFSPSRRGIPTGIWVTWVPMGTMIMYIAAPLLGKSGGWQHVWWFASGYTALAFVLFLFCFRMPETSETPESSPKRQQSSLPKSAVFNIWMLAATFMLFNVITISLKSYLPAFLELVRNYPPGKASGIINIMILVSMLAGPLTGIISDKTGSRKGPLVVGCLTACISVTIPFMATGFPVAVALFLLGISCGNIATTAFAAASEITGDSGAGTGVSIVAFGQYMGMSVGPVLFSMTAAAQGWHAAGFLLAPVAVIACIAACFVKIR